MIFLLLALTAAAGDDEGPPPEDTPVVDSHPPPPETAVVVKVYDGDTITLSTGDKVRLRGANTPELKPSEPYGIEARDATRGLVDGKTVTLSYGSVKRDGYGRLLASVSMDGQDLAQFLLERGLAHLYVIPPAEMDLAPLIAAQEQARQARRGIWTNPTFQGIVHITSFHANADGDDRSNINGEYFRICNLSPNPVDLAGFRVSDISGRSWEFPSVVVPAGNTVKIHSGRGQNQLDSSEQLEIFLQSADPIWNNQEDRVTIYDRYGKVVDTRLHSVEGTTP